jgi:hypothetical protein
VKVKEARRGMMFGCDMLPYFYSYEYKILCEVYYE